MTLQEFITKYTGQKVRGGQCGELVRQYWIDVDKTNPPSYPDSKDYWFDQVPGYDKISSSPQPGDIAIYNSHGVYPEGHSAIYVGPGVFEQNADPDGAAAHVFNRANIYLLGYLRKKGSSTVIYPNSGDLTNIFDETGWPGHPPNANDNAYWTTGTGNANWSKGADQVQKDLLYSVITYVGQHPKTVTSSSNADAKLAQIKQIVG